MFLAGRLSFNKQSFLRLHLQSHPQVFAAWLAKAAPWAHVTRCALLYVWMIVFVVMRPAEVWACAHGLADGRMVVDDMGA
mgnify:CR=1 FL=1